MRTFLAALALTFLFSRPNTAQALAPFPHRQFFSADGNPLAGGFVYTNAVGTSTLRATYTDTAERAQNTTPIVPDSGGFANIRLSANSHKFVVRNSSGIWQWTVDNINESLPNAVKIGTAQTSAGAQPFAKQLTTTRPNNALNATQFPGADIGARVTAAINSVRPSNPLHEIDGNYAEPTVYIPLGSYSYSTTITIASPAILVCEPGTVLNYTGSGVAVQVGPAGLNVTTIHYAPYSITGCTFTGGASMTYGIYFEPYVVNTFTNNVHYWNFGNSTAYAVYYANDNWNSNSTNDLWWSTTGAQNYLNFAAGDSLITIDHLTAHGGNVGVILQGTKSSLSNSQMSSFSQPVIVLGSSFGVQLINNDFEAASNYGIVGFGDSTNDGAPVYGLNLIGNRANMHQEEGYKGSLVYPMNVNTGLVGAYLIGNKVTNLASTAYLVNQNIGVSGQMNNFAEQNTNIDGSSPLTLAYLHPAGSPAWTGPQGDVFAITGLSVGGGSPISSSNDLARLSRPNIWTGHQYVSGTIEMDNGHNIIGYSGASGGTMTIKIDPSSGNLYLSGLNSGYNVCATTGGELTTSSCGPFTASFTTTSTTVDNVTVMGMTASGHCSMAATNSLAAKNIATTYISAKTTNRITVTHTGMASMTYDVMCTPN